jgi:HTH-type transcriptional regulator, competence development regulator
VTVTRGSGRVLSRYNQAGSCSGCATPVSRAGVREPYSVADIGARLRALRLRRGMSLAIVGGLAGISAPYLSMVETGKRRLDRYSLIVGLADALGVPPDALTSDAADASRRVRDELPDAKRRALADGLADSAALAARDAVGMSA